MAKEKSYCIICGKEKSGIPVEKDYVIAAIRWFKTNITKNEKNNNLVVCRDCYPKYKQQRKRYLSRQRIYIGLGAVFVVVGVLVARTAASVLVCLGVFALLYLFSLASYIPKISVKEAKGE